MALDDPITDRPDVFAPFLEEILPDRLDHPADAEAHVDGAGIEVRLSISEATPGEFAMPGNRSRIAPKGLRDLCRRYGYAVTDIEASHTHGVDRAVLHLDLVFEPVGA